MKTKHTPKPWVVDTHETDVIFGNDLRLATVVKFREEWRANARLIAAAPDLLEALKWAVQQIQDDLDPEHQEAMDACLAAVAKAEDEPEPTRNIMFDLAASIDTHKSFNELTVSELVAAARARLDRIEEDNEITAFGYCDEYDLNHET